jgi:hypothetical protein
MGVIAILVAVAALFWAIERFSAWLDVPDDEDDVL